MLKWFKRQNAWEPLKSWNKFKTILIEKYGIPKARSTLQQLLEIKQKGLVTKYREEFEMMASAVRGLQEQVLETTFIKGLHEEIQVELELLCPMGL